MRCARRCRLSGGFLGEAIRCRNGRPRATAHILTWAIGLLLLDNCDFAAMRRAHGPGTKVAGALVVSLLAIEGANGVNLNPLVLT